MRQSSRLPPTEMFRPPVVPTITVQEAHERLSAAGDASLLVDVRNPDEFAQARIPGSVLVPLPFFAQRFAELPADRPLLLVCRTGDRSSTATAYLMRNGFEQVANVAGGIVAWYQAGLPVVTGRPEPGDGELPR
jgi:rhodanese-related sulfurtransferase